MKEISNITLGVNHQFLYPESMVDGNAHTETLRELAATDLVDALDCWIWPDEQRGKEEAELLRDSGKVINYNIGDRSGFKPVVPASSDPAERQYALDIIHAEIDRALSVGAKKIVIGSGPDFPDNREQAKENFLEFMLKLKTFLPKKGVEICLEPTDRDIDKFFLFGPVEETAAFLRAVRNAGFGRVSMLLDMGHIPLMHNDLIRAVKEGGDVIDHIHLGNCMFKDASDPMYGDRHVCWDYPGGEYTGEDLYPILNELYHIGYFNHPCTVSFEMRCFNGLSALESLKKFCDIFYEVAGNLPI
ncbi:MAG: sugar phosphate isomerase/epimerase family protein [Candidatus Limivicinus sp.]|jgi:sugar phosphate isomerase/epimerase